MAENASAETQGPAQLETWVDRYGNYLYRFALARVHAPHIAEDLVQETFLAALKGWARFEGRSSGKTWLTSILKHKIIDFIRKDVRERPSDNLEAVIDATDAMFTPKGEWAVAPKRWDINPERVYEQKEFMSQLRECLATLPERMARAFTLREMDGLSTKEICDILDITESNSWVILYRARMALRRCLEVNWDIRGPGTTD
jgi:RNA polymerase sigma-70 factor (ECF subfamily)